MPRRLLRDGRIVQDEWSYLAESADGAAALILTFAEWQSERAAWVARGGRLGVVLQPADKVELLAPDLSRLELIGAQFSGPSEGRGYSQARILREQWKFGGELRATGLRAPGSVVLHGALRLQQLRTGGSRHRGCSRGAVDVLEGLSALQRRRTAVQAAAPPAETTCQRLKRRGSPCSPAPPRAVKVAA